MYFDTFSEFIAMGGHALYVWSAYAAFLVILAWVAFDVISCRRLNVAKAKKAWKREQLRSADAERKDA